MGKKQIDKMVEGIFDRFVYENSEFKNLKEAYKSMGAFGISFDECKDLIKEGIRIGLMRKEENIARLLSKPRHGVSASQGESEAPTTEDRGLQR